MSVSEHSKHFMLEAIRQAMRAQEQDEVPIGCVIVHDGEIIGKGFNQREELQQPSAHAEMVAIEEAARNIGSWRLEDCDLYVTLEPCPMCAGAIIQSRIRKVYFGAFDPKGGSVETCTRLFEVPQYNHHPEWEGGLLEEECAGLLRSFFRQKRKKRIQPASEDCQQQKAEPDAEQPDSVCCCSENN